MEAIFAPSSTKQSFSPYNKHTKNHPNTRSDFNIYRSTENLAPMNYIIHGGSGGGFLFAPPPPLPPPSMTFSYPPPSPVMYPMNQHNNRRQSPVQPPLLPLPISKPRHNSLPSPMVARKSNRPRDLSLSTPKKSKNQINKRDEVKQLAQSVTVPKAVSKVLSSLPPSSFSSMAGNNVNNIVLSIEDLERFSGSVFTPSPHPSSLPLPKFSVKPKLSCTAEAGAAVDSGATDNLRRILRLR